MKKLLFLLCCALFPIASFGQDMSQQPQTTPSPQATAKPQISACTDAAFQNFDFWVGTWVVKDHKDKEIGRSEVTKVAGGCGILESWKGGDGTPGTSINYFDKQSGKWTQHWVGGGGELLHLTGAPEGKAMVLSGIRVTPTGQIIDRISWTLLKDGRVQQEWDTSTDGGQTWKTSFLGFYSRAS